MRRLGVLAMIAAMAAPGFAASPATTRMLSVVQLEEMLQSVRGISDGALARQLSDTRLTQRLTNARLVQIEARLPGHQSREQVLILADESEFLETPAEDRLADAVPDQAAQAAILARADAYIRDTVARWPSFSALRATTRYEGTATILPARLQDDLDTRVGANLLRSPSAQNWECPGPPRLPMRRVDVIERATLPILYRRGHALHAFSAGGEFSCMQGGVNTSDELGEIPVIVPLIAHNGHAVWSHWEAGPEGALAVFSFAASINEASSTAEEARQVNLEGEVAVNPKDGSIFRLTEVRRWERNSFAREYDTSVEFGPIAMAGVRLLLPIRRVAMFLTPILKPSTWNATIEGYYRRFHLEKSPLQEYLNDVRFGEYRAYAPAATENGVNSSTDGVAVNRP